MTNIRRDRGRLALLAAVLLALAAALLPSLPAAAQTPASPTPAGQSPSAPADAPATRTVSIVQLEGPIDGAFAGYLRRELREAAERGDAALVLRLDATGTIGTDAAELAAAVRDSPVPVTAWVGPADAVVGGGVTALWLAAAKRLVGTDAQIRPVLPLRPGGDEDQSLPSSLGEVPAALRSAGDGLDARGVLGAKLAEFVPRRTTDTGGGRIVDGTVNSLKDAVVQSLPAGLGQRDVVIRFANPSLLQRVRHSLSTTPWLVYLLLVSGLGAIVFELFQRGFGPAGYSGVLLVALAAFGLVWLPVNPLALGLVLAGTGALALDVARGGLGPLTWGGTAALAVGSWWFIPTSDRGDLSVPIPVAILGVLGSWVFYVVVMTVVLRALRQQSPDVGLALVGRTGEVRSTLNPQGHVLVDGALWRARAIEWDGPVEAGTQVEVTGVDADALMLDVQPVR